MFERFTDRARRVLVLAQEDARLLNHDFIGTEHLLLGLIHEGGVAAQVLESSGISLEAVRNGVAETVGAGRPSGSPPFTPRAKKVLELSLRESLQLGHSHIGTEHLLLGLIREGEGVAVHILKDLGATLEQLRLEVIRRMSMSSEGVGYVSDRLPAPPRCPRCGTGLTEAARYRVVAVPAQDAESGEPKSSVPVVYCDSCGTALGISDIGRGLL